MSDLLTITDEALEKVLEVRSSEPDGEALALWVEINGQQAGAYTYLMEFRPKAELPGDVVLDDSAGLTVAIPAECADNLRGAVLGFNGGMVMQNPNKPEPPPSPFADADLSGELAQRVIAVIDEQVNPQIAAHGGAARLAAIEGSIAYVELSGGCQGCGSAKATLKQGIEVIILDLVPEITEVVDVTDHLAGTNPYY
ncbi:MAG: NifU family protein [Acidimicrobiia bacterium]